MSTMKARDVPPEVRKKVGPYVDELVRTVFKNLPGDDRAKCYNAALTKAVQDKFTWPHPPGGALLSEQLRLCRARAEAPEKPKPSKRRAPLHERIAKQAKRGATDEDMVVTACRAAAAAISFDDATHAITIANKSAVKRGLQAVGVQLAASKFCAMLSASDDGGFPELYECLNAAPWPEGTELPLHAGDFFAKVAAMSSADRLKVVVRSKVTNAPPAPTRWEPSPPPPLKRAASKPAALTKQDQNTSTIVAVGPPTPMTAATQFALRALAGEKQATKTGKQKVKVRRKGETKWEEYTSQTEAERKVPGLTRRILRDIFSGEASDKFEACLVSKEQPINKPWAYGAAASALGFRQAIVQAADLEKAVSELVDRAVLPDSVKERPKSWGALLKCASSLSSRDQRLLFEQTRRAENERVLKLREAGCDLGREVQRTLRRDEAEEGLRRDVEALSDLLRLGYNLLDDETTQRAFEGEVKVSYLPSHVVDDRRPEYVWYKGKRVELKAGPWYRRYAIGDGRIELGSAGGADSPYGPPKTLVATITRPEPGDAAILTDAGARGDTGLLHRGDQGRFAATFSARVPAGAYVRQLPFCSFRQMKKLGFELVGETEAVTTANGATVDGFEKCRFAYRLTEGGPDQMAALQEEFLRFRKDLLGVTLKDKRLAKGVVASTRRNQNGATDAPQVVSFQFVVPCRATGATPRTERALQHLRDMGYPLMAELDHRCILNSVAFEFLAYRDPSLGGRWHVDKAKDLLLSALQMKSVTMKEGANLQRSKQHFTRADLAQMEECSDGDSVI